VKPFALTSADQFRPAPPPTFESEQLKKEIDEVIATNANLTLEQKAIVEFMRDGPRSTGQSGHWLRFAQDLSRRDHYTLDQDIKLFFSIGNVVFDAFISCWETKRHYDTSRPYWWVRLYHKGEKIRAWAGPGKGTALIPAEDWRPYSPETFITPPFPGYVSGHANASAAAARILELYSGSDHYGAIAVRKVGELTEDAFTTARMQAVDGVPATDTPESKEIVLDLPTFSGTAEMAAVSRLWGGYHIRTDNEQGLLMGKKIADYSWPIYQSYFDGTIDQ
jgi:PAP2 superfamily